MKVGGVARQKLGPIPHIGGVCSIIKVVLKCYYQITWAGHAPQVACEKGRLYKSALRQIMTHLNESSSNIHGAIQADMIKQQ